MKIVFTLFFTFFLGIATFAQEQSLLSAPPERSSLSVKLQVYPNPATEYVNIKLESVRVSDVHISLHNIIGNAVEVESEAVDDQEIRFRVKDLSVGYYLVSVRDKTNGTSGTVKFLKR